MSSRPALVYIASSRPATDIQLDPDSKQSKANILTCFSKYSKHIQYFVAKFNVICCFTDIFFKLKQVGFYSNPFVRSFKEEINKVCIPRINIT